MMQEFRSEFLEPAALHQRQSRCSSQANSEAPFLPAVIFIITVTFLVLVEKF